MTDRDSFTKGYLLGKVLKLPPFDRPAQVPLSAASGTYDKNSFLSGLAAALSARGVGLSGDWNAAHSQFVTFPQWAAHFGFTPVESDFTLIHADGQSTFSLSLDFTRSVFQGSTRKNVSYTRVYSDSEPSNPEVNYNNKNLILFEDGGKTILWSEWTNVYKVGAIYEAFAPVDGYYTQTAGRPCAEGEIISAQGNVYPFSYVWYDYPTKYLLQGHPLTADFAAADQFKEILFNAGYTVVGGFAQFFPPVMTVTPARPEAELSSQSRPGNVSGDYGIVRADGTISRIWTGQIIRENPDGNGGIFYNPATNQSAAFSDWSYDYTARAYSLTGDTVSVTYGDSLLTIQQGGQTYRLAYAIRS